MHFTLQQKVLFKHCDPAGIVFYPRYFEMINDGIEAMFSDQLEWPFERIHAAGGVPTVSFNVTFKAPSRHGDHLDLNISIQAIEGSSLTVQTVAIGGDETRFVADQVLVCVNASGQPTRWPEDVRRKVDKLMEDTA